jgi:hypothetical protein
MSFINKSVNYAQTVLLKTKYLSPLLKSYNNHLLKAQASSSITASIDYHIVPNNNKKYYLYVTQKDVLENCNNNFDLLYFFPDKATHDHFANSKLDANEIGDFFVEIDHLFTDSFLFEGYIYKTDNKTHFLISDILIKNNNVVECDYALRYTLINEIIMFMDSTCNLNNHLSIGIHPIFRCENESMINVFYNNFRHKKEICALENISNFTKTRFVKPKWASFSRENKAIMRGKYTDVYEVFNSTTRNKEGILYIKGIRESMFMKNMFAKDEKEITMMCTFNETFNKWSPVLPEIN